MVGRRWDARQPYESLCCLERGGSEFDELHDQVHGHAVSEVVHHLGDARRIRVRVRPSIVEDIQLSLEFRPQNVGVVKFHEVIRPNGHTLSIVIVPPVCELVVCASLHNVGLESLESSFLVHGEMSWMMQSKERGRRLRDDTHNSGTLLVRVIHGQQGKEGR
jgi:hypothetical protein